MDIFEAIENRHSVRRYLDKKIPDDIIEILNREIYNCNVEGALNIQLVCNRPEAFQGIKASYGKLQNVNNYIALVGKKSNTLDYRVGYYGERIVIKAQQLGLNTCWLGGTYSKRKA
ncbi:MAG: nitroreductase, partial [Clostridia bacterium]|nr:nitroreductase [Clostridia bacterium]